MRRGRLRQEILVKYTAIISGLCKRGKLEEAFAVFELINSMGIKADEFVYATLIDGVCRKGQVDRVFGLLEEMERKGICPGVVTYNIVVNGFCKGGRMLEADEFSKVVEGDVVTYSTLLHGYVREENVIGVVEVKKRIEEAGVSMDNIMCNVLIKALFMMGEVNSAYGLYLSMPDMGLVADAVTYCTMIDGFCKLGKIDEALEVFDQHRKANVLSVACYNCIIAALCEKNAVEMAMEVFIELNESGLALDAGIYKIMVKAIFERESTDGVLKFIYRIQNLKLEVFDTIINHSINFLCQRGFAEAAREVYATMRRKGLVANSKFCYEILKTLTDDGKIYLIKPLLGIFFKEYGLYKSKAFGIILRYLCQLDIGYAISFLDKMKGNGINVVIPVSALKKLSLTGKVLDAHRLIVTFEDNLPPMNVIDFSIIINGLCKGGHIFEALDLCAFAKKKRIVLNIVSYNTVIYGLCRQGFLMEAFRLFDSLERIDLRPSEITYAMLIATLCREGYLPDAKKLLERMVLSGLKPNARIYNSFIDGYCKFGRTDEALYLLHDLETKFIKPDEFTVSCLINGCCQKGEMESALEFYSEFKRKGVFPDFLGFLFMLRGLCTKGRMEEARSILREMLQSDSVIELLGKVDTGVESESIEVFLHILCEQGSIQEAVTILNEVGYTFFPVHRWFTGGNKLENSKKLDELEALSAPVTKSVTTSIINGQDPGLCDEKEPENIDRDSDSLTKRMQFSDIHLCYSMIASFCSKGELHKANRLAKKMLSKLV